MMNIQDMRLWNFTKFLGVYVIPLVLGCFILASFFQLINFLPPLIFGLIVIVCFVVFCYFIIKYLYWLMENEKVNDWIAKPWNNSIIFKHK